MKKAGKKKTPSQSSIKLNKKTQRKKFSSKKTSKSKEKGKSKTRKRKLHINDSIWELPLIKKKKK